MSRIRRIAPRLSRGGLLGNTEGPESYLRELDTLPSQFCRATGGTETVISQGGKFYRVHTFTDTDPTSLLLNFDGSNGSTTFTDDSGWGHAVTANGNAAISTTQSKFGGSSAAFDGNGDYLSLGILSQVAFNTGDFTIEFWARKSANGTNTYDGVCSSDVTGGAVSGFAVELSDERGFAFISGDAVVASYNFDPNDSLWHHYAVCRSGTTLRLFTDGVVRETVTYSTSIGAAHAIRIGAYGPVSASAFFFNGYIDSLRITKGQALYTSAFTPSTTALTRVGSGSLTFTRGGALEYLVVGGGGGGGYDVGGGGGAGGLLSGKLVTGGSLGICVGGGGGSGINSSKQGYNGADSSFFNITALGGGGGGGFQTGGGGRNGGSGGGGGAFSAGNIVAGSGEAGPPLQGYDGGAGALNGFTGNYGSGGGGGGAGGVGQSAASGADGGVGVQSDISGSATYYAGGGGGSDDSGSGGDGGLGGGGDADGVNGTANTGGGGGGAGTSTGGSGGSGIVIARYRITQAEYEAEAA